MADPPSGPAFTILDSAYNQAQMGANVGRYNLYWSQLQPSINDPWDWTKLDPLKAAISAGKSSNSNYRAVVMLDGIPADVDGRQSAHYVNTESGADQYGAAIGLIMNHLDGYCDFIELGNEVNQLEWVKRRDPVTNWPYWVHVNPTAGAIPPTDYGRMVAYATFWVNACCGSAKNILAGALALRGGDDTWVADQIPSTYAQTMADTANFYLYAICGSNAAKRVELQNAWRLSLHPYPRLGKDQGGLWSWQHNNYTGDWTSTMAGSTVYSDWNLFKTKFPYKRIWFTETGVSSEKVEAPNGQADFLHSLCNLAIANQPQLEGLVNFGFTDLDPTVQDSTSPFYHMGVVSDTDGITKKPAGARLKTIWASWA